VGGEAFELLADRHGSSGPPRRRWAADGLVEPSCVAGCASGLLVSFKESPAKLGPAFTVDVPLRREAEGGVFGVGRLDVPDPVKCDLLPEGDVPEFRVDRVRRSGNSFVREIIAYAFQDMGRRGGGTVADEGALEFVHELWRFDYHAIDRTQRLAFNSSAPVHARLTTGKAWLESDHVMEVSESSLSREHMEHLWESVRRDVHHPREGILGPSSISWKVNRESAVFLGAGRAALLQLAHPWVAAALDQHSNLRADPLARFHNTFRVVFTMVFGTLDQALAASRHLYQLHTRIQGELPATVAGYRRGSHYEANEVNALLWVYATLVQSALVAYDCVQPPLARDEREAYYGESRSMAALFGIPVAALPLDWSGFEAYVGAMLSSDKLGVDALAREMAHRVLHGRGSWVPVPHWYRALTTAWLPKRIRDEFSLPFGSREQDGYARASRWLPRLYRRLPARARFVGPYQEAQSRLAGRDADRLTRVSNRFWMGQPRMMFGKYVDPE
jgi:uncharacterized protein (DUF2236 family)